MSVFGDILVQIRENIEYEYGLFSRSVTIVN